MAKMGRPKSDVIKDKIVTIRMSAEEHQKLRDYSEKHQQTITKSRDYSSEKIERKGEV